MATLLPVDFSPWALGQRPGPLTLCWSWQVAGRGNACWSPSPPVFWAKIRYLLEGEQTHPLKGREEPRLASLRHFLGH